MKKLLSFTLLLIILSCSLSFGSPAVNESEIQVKAKAAVLMDASTGEVLYSFNENERLYPASVTKIMPLLLFMEALDSGKIALTDTVTASPTAASKGGSQIWLKEGEQMTVDELLRATAIASANDACTALGEHIAGSETGFVKMMNDRAKALGMMDTNFVNYSGLDDDTTEHLTTAYDIALMSKELLSHERIKTYTTVWMDSLRNGETQLVNTNKLVRFYSGTTGLKTGTTTKAGYCLSASAERDGLHLIAVVMGADNSSERFEGAKAMRNAGVLEKPKVDAAMALHISSGVPSGLVLAGTGTTMAGCIFFRIQVTGTGCHGAMPESGVDPINIAAHIHLSLQEIIAREVCSFTPATVTVGRVAAGEAPNIIPEKAVMEGSIRTMDKETGAMIYRRIVDIATHTAELFRGQAVVEEISSVPPLKNDAELVTQMVGFIGEIYDAKKLVPLESGGTGSEDFAVISQEVPCCYLFLGAGTQQEDPAYGKPMHNECVVFNEAILPVGSAIFTHCALRWLQSQQYGSVG